MDLLQAQSARLRKLLAAARAFECAGQAGGLPPVFFMTDPQRTPDPAKIAARLPAGWGIVYRHFGAADRFATGARLADIAAARGLLLLVSADPDLAEATGGHGVHWPKAAIPRRLVRPRHLVETASAHTPAQVRRAAAADLDAVFVSAVFPSLSPSAPSALGPMRFRRLAARAPLPVYALGGLAADNSGRLAGARNIAGVAMVGEMTTVIGNTGETLGAAVA